MITSIQYATIMKSKVLNAAHMRIMVLAMLLSATLAPVAIAEVKWEEDNWLYTMGQEFLENGDEFGCYGMPNLEWKADPGAVAIECKEYISERIDASKWGPNPISTYTPSGLTAYQHTIIANQGFMIHGDNTGQSAKAWHNSENEPINEYDWFDLGRRGGSLEKGIADVDRVEDELDAGGFVNMYWIGRISDLNVRHDASVIDMVTERNDVWYTTWGEVYSYALKDVTNFIIIFLEVYCSFSLIQHNVKRCAACLECSSDVGCRYWKFISPKFNFITYV